MDPSASAEAGGPAAEKPRATPAELRAFAGHFTTGVAVVTSRASTGAFCGTTINAVSSLSLSPPLFLICLDNTSNTLDAVLASAAFTIHFLAKDQADISRTFAVKGRDKFAGIAHRVGASGCPIIDGVLAVAECAVSEVCPGGDHTIVIGEVTAVAVHGGEPLLFHRGGYAALDAARIAP